MAGVVLVLTCGAPAVLPARPLPAQLRALRASLSALDAAARRHAAISNPVLDAMDRERADRLAVTIDAGIRGILAGLSGRPGDDSDAAAARAAARQALSDLCGHLESDALTGRSPAVRAGDLSELEAAIARADESVALPRAHLGVAIYRQGRYAPGIRYLADGPPLMVSDGPESLPAWRLGRGPAQGVPAPTERRGVLAARTIRAATRLRVYLWHANAAPGSQFVSVTLENRAAAPLAWSAGVWGGATARTGFLAHGIDLARDYLSRAGPPSLPGRAAAPGGMERVREWDIGRAGDLAGAILELAVGDADHPVDAVLRVVAHTSTGDFAVRGPVLEQYGDRPGNAEYARPMHSRGFYAHGTVKVLHDAVDLSDDGYHAVGVFDTAYSPGAPRPPDGLPDEGSAYEGQPIGRANNGNWGVEYRFYLLARNPSDRPRRLRVRFMARGTGQPYAGAFGWIGSSMVDERFGPKALEPIEYAPAGGRAAKSDAASVEDRIVPPGGEVIALFRFMHAGAATLPVSIVYQASAG